MLANEIVAWRREGKEMSREARELYERAKKRLEKKVADRLRLKEL